MSALLTLRYRSSSSRLLSTRLSSLSFSTAGCLYSSRVKVDGFHSVSNSPNSYHQPIPILMRTCIGVLCSKMRNSRSAPRPKTTDVEKKTTHVPIPISLAILNLTSPAALYIFVFVFVFSRSVHCSDLDCDFDSDSEEAEEARVLSATYGGPKKNALSLCKMSSGTLDVQLPIS